MRVYPHPWWLGEGRARRVVVVGRGEGEGKRKLGELVLNRPLGWTLLWFTDRFFLTPMASRKQLEFLVGNRSFSWVLSW